MRSSIRTTFALFLLTLGVCSPASAEGPPLRLKVSVIHATKQKTPADANLKVIQAALSEAFAGYEGFTRLRSEERTLSGDVPVSIDLPNGETAEFRHVGVEKNLHKVHVSIPTSKVDIVQKGPLKKVFYPATVKYLGGILILAAYLAPSEPAPPEPLAPKSVPLELAPKK